MASTNSATDMVGSEGGLTDRQNIDIGASLIIDSCRLSHACPSPKEFNARGDMDGTGTGRVRDAGAQRPLWPGGGEDGPQWRKPRDWSRPASSPILSPNADHLVSSACKEPLRVVK